jgi:excisionase family DNA binding protein
MIPGFDFNALVDAVAVRLAEHLRDELGTASAGTIRPRLLTVDQAAAYLGRSKAAVEHMVASGKLPTVRADRRVFVDVEDLDRWIREHKQAEM